MFFIRILREYQRGVVFRLGRLLDPKGPGVVLLIPIVDPLVIEEHPIALQLRYLQTLLEIGGSNSSTIIFPAPIDLIKPFLERAPEQPAITPSLEPERRQAA